MHIKDFVIVPLLAAVQVHGQQEAFRLALAESADLECQSPEHESNSIWVRVVLNYTEACYNINDLFSEEFGSGTDGLSTCLWEDDDCDHEWEARQPKNYGPTANYSYISWMVTTNPGEWSGFPNYDPADVTVRVFGGEDCQETSETPFYQWGNCDEPANDCTQLPYSVQSFQALKTPGQNKSDGCLVGAERGGAGREHYVQLMWLFAFAIGAVVLNN
ncbi:hypothetical protein Q7P35_010876 [Cladosporium inversicolor]